MVEFPLYFSAYDMAFYVPGWLTQHSMESQR